MAQMKKIPTMTTLRPFLNKSAFTIPRRDNKLMITGISKINPKISNVDKINPM